MTARARRSPRRRALLLAAILLGAVLGAEGLVRARAHWRYGRYLDVYDLHEERGDPPLRATKPNLDVVFAGNAHIRTDSLGFRNPELEAPKRQGTLRIAFVGGSTTFCTQVASNEEAWPSLVREGLAEAWDGLPVEYVNAGVTGNCVVDSERAVERRLAQLAPDVVVVYHATNDLAVDTERLAAAAGLYTEPDRHWLEDWSLFYHLVRKNTHVMKALAVGESADGKLDAFDPAPLAAAFEQRVRSLVERASTVADVVVVVTFATRFRANQPRDVQLANLAQSFTFMPYLTPEATLAGYVAYNGALRRAADATGAQLVEFADAIPGDAAHFHDSVHLNATGCAVLAERLVADLRASEAFLALIDAKRAARAESLLGAQRR